MSSILRLQERSLRNFRPSGRSSWPMCHSKCPPVIQKSALQIIGRSLILGHCRAKGDMITNASAIKRLSFVDALRGVAATGVLLFHALEGHHVTAFFASLPAWLQFPVEHGSLGVAIFFVLSGFVISHSLYRQRMTLNLLGRFCLRRSLRLDPPYWFAIALSLAFGVLSTAVVADHEAVRHSWAQVV